MKALFFAIIGCLVFVEICLGNTIQVPSQQPTIQAGIDAAVNGDTVLVADGTYTGDGNRDIDFNGKAIVVTSERGYNFTWIDVQGEYRGFIFQNGETADSKLDGFTITGIVASLSLPQDPCIDPAVHYSGVICNNRGIEASPTISNCQFADNSSMQGTGIAIFSSSPVIDSCRFIHNFGINAGAIFLYATQDCIIQNCLFFENTVDDKGGAVFAYSCYGSVTIENCQFTNNTANTASGAVRVVGSTVDVTGSTFEGNNANYGGISCIVPIIHPIEKRAAGTWANCTMYDNKSPNGTFHIHESISNIYFENCVIAEGTGGTVKIDIGGTVPTLNCCNLYGNSGGDWTTPINGQLGTNGNISEPPLFMYPDTSDFRLQYCSPCMPNMNDCGNLIGAYDIAVEETTPPSFSCHTDTLEYYLPPDTSGECHVPLATYDVAEDCMPITLEPASAWWGEYGGIYWTADTGGLYHFRAMAVKPPYGGDTCDVYVYVKGPQITCPEVDYTAHPDLSGLINIILTIQNVFSEHVTVTPDIANWLNLSPVQFLQFSADTAGTYIFQVIAETRFGRDSCEVTVIVGGPVIDCPSDTLCVQPDGIGQVCIDLPINSNSISEVTAGEATWSNDLLCFFPDDTGGFYTFPVAVIDAFGWDSCEVAISVMPQVNSNTTPINVNSCPGEEVCISYNFDFVTTDNILVLSANATWTEDSICVTPNDTGLMSFQIYAGTGNCYDTATVTLNIHCPDTINITPEGTIQAAVDAASEGDFILLEDGVYTGEGNRNIDFSGKNLTLRSKHGSANCIIDCQSDMQNWDSAFVAIWFHSNEDERTVIDGITFRSGLPYAIRCDSANPTIQNCFFDHNALGVYLLFGSDNYINNCVFYGNRPLDSRGAGAKIYQASPVFENCLFLDNSGWGGGAAIESSPSEPIFRNCTFTKNGYNYYHDDAMGGVIFLSWGTHPRFEDCTFYSNKGCGSTLFIDGTTPCFADFTRCIISFGIDATDHYYAGGPINCSDAAGSQINLTCCNVYGNTAGDYIDCISGELGTNGNFSADPLFCDTTANDLHLLAGSPCLPENNTCGVQIGAYGLGGFNTPVGTDVEVEQNNVTVTFDSVQIIGETEIGIDSTGPDMPGNITTVPTNPEQFYDIQTSALYDGFISICIVYDDADVDGDETDMMIMHWVDTAWINITVSHDTVNNIICGETESLSPFILTQPYIGGDCCIDIRGDTNMDGKYLPYITDLTYLVDYIFHSGSEPSCIEEADLTLDCITNISDLTYIVDFIFRSGAPPPACSEQCVVGAFKPLGDVTIYTYKGKKNSTTLSLESDFDLRGIQIDMIGSSKESPVKLVNKNFELLYHEKDKQAKVGLLDLEGVEIIKKGETQLVQLKGDYEIISAVVSDMKHRSIIPLISETFKAPNLPESYSLDQNYPNPFNPLTKIEFALPNNTYVKLEIFNIIGQRITSLIDNDLDAGYHTVDWNGTNSSGQRVSSGIYFYKITADEFMQSKKMLLLK